MSPGGQEATPNQKFLPMILANMILWLGLSFVFTLALCRAASGAMPKPCVVR